MFCNQCFFTMLQKPTTDQPSGSLLWFYRFMALTFAKPRSKLVRTPSKKRWSTLSVAVRLWTLRFTRIQRLILSSSIQVEWILQFRFESLKSIAAWCNKWNFGRNRKVNFFSSTALAANAAKLVTIKFPMASRFCSSKGVRNISLFDKRFNQRSVLHNALVHML